MSIGPQGDLPDPAWQAEADLLADGREVLDRLTRSPRYRHLYPDGANAALLLEAYQDLLRLRTVARVRARPRAQRRALAGLIRRALQRDALARTLRLTWRYPLPRLEPLPKPLHDVVQAALARVDHDVRDEVATVVAGHESTPDLHPASSHAEQVRLQRGLTQFRTALVNQALARPHSIASLHPQILQLAASPQPRRRQRPLLTLFLVKLPLYLWMSVFIVLGVAYWSAFVFFNGETLGRFVSDRVSGILDGDLRMRSIYWRPRLIVDLVTGTPTPLLVEDVTIYEPYKSVVDEKGFKTAEASQVELSLVLHEIIPWNRLGIPQVLEIPWVLHFAEVRATEPVTLNVRQYQTTTLDGREVVLLGLRDAFQLHDFKPRSDGPGLSIYVDDAVVERAILTLDFTDTSIWGVATMLRDLNLGLWFDAPDGRLPAPERLPFRFRAAAKATRGVLALREYQFALRDWELERFSSGTQHAPLADVEFDGHGFADDSPVQLTGALRDVFRRTYADGSEVPASVPIIAEVEALATDAGPIVDSLVRQLELGTAKVDAHGVPLAATIEGPLDNPVYYLAGDGLTLDVLDEPGWVMRDVTVGATLTRAHVEDHWSQWVELDVPHYVFRVDTFEGKVLDGRFALAPALREASSHQVVFPEDGTGEPWMLSARLAIDGVDPGRLVPDQPGVAAILSGAATGTVDLVRLLLEGGGNDPAAPASTPDAASESPLRRVELDFQDVRAVRNRSAAEDGLPQTWRIHGPLTMDDEGVVSSRELAVAVDGGRLVIRGGVDLEAERLRTVDLDLDVNDGPAFLAAFGLDPYFDQASATLTLQGPLVAPDAESGELSVTGLGLGRLGTTDVARARLSMKAGTLRLHSPDARLFGGDGSVDLDLVLSDGHRWLDQPRVRAAVEVDDADLAQLVGEQVKGRATIRVQIDDGEGKPAPFSAIRVHGNAQVPTMEVGGTRYGNARAEFELTPERLRIEHLSLPIHRSISPFHAPHVTVAIGKLEAQGTVGLEDDPSLDLEVSARGVPLDVVSRLFDAEIPVRGQFGQGTAFHVGGSVGRPSIEGTVRLAGLDVYGVKLGSGTVVVASRDVDAAGPLAAHRELRAQGEFASPSAGDRRVDWTMDAVVAMAKAREGQDSRPSVEAQARLYFEDVALGELFSAARLDTLTKHVGGRLEGLTAQALTCNPGAPMLSDCVDEQETEQSFALDLELERMWLRDRNARRMAGDPCAVGTSLCSRNPLRVRVDWPVIRLQQPWHIGAGRRTRSDFEISGVFDFSEPPPDSEPQRCTSTTPPRFTARGEGDARLAGTLELIALTSLLRSFGLEPRGGMLQADLEVDGLALDPRITGRVELSREFGPIELGLAETSLDLTINAVDVEIFDGRLYAETEIAAKGAALQVGTVGRDRTYFTLAGPCRGVFSLAASGALSGELIQALLPDGTASVAGSAGVPRFSVRGRIDDEAVIERMRGTVEFNAEHSLTVETSLGLEPIRTRSGRIDVQRCGDDERCPGGRNDGAYAVFVGGRLAATASRQPQGALDVDIGTRGGAQLWGQVFILPSLDGFDDARLYLNLEDVFYRDYDTRGRPRLEASVSSRAMTIRDGDPLVIRGTLNVERSRWLKDALEGANVIRLTEEVDVAEAPPPEWVQTTEFDLDVRTTTPLRIDNNIASGVEASVAARVTGTYENLTVQGRIDVEPGGIVNLPFIKGEFEIQEGRVLVDRDIGNAEVDVVAVRTEPIFIQDVGSRQLAVRLVGPLDAIGWECDAGLYGAQAMDDKRACLDYLMFGSQEPALAQVDAQRTGSGGFLYPRKGLQVISNVAEFDVTKQLVEASPRLETYVPDVRLQLGQVGPELNIETPRDWFDFGYGSATIGFSYTRGYPGFLLRQNREFHLNLEILEPFSLEMRQSNRSYLNERIIFDPLTQRSIEAGFVFEIPSMR